MLLFMLAFLFAFGKKWFLVQNVFIHLISGHVLEPKQKKLFTGSTYFKRVPGGTVGIRLFFSQHDDGGRDDPNGHSS